MAYITTNHRFIIDDKHPNDMFDEMENFFSLYTTAIDDLQRVTFSCPVPTSFDITANKKMAESYRQFIQSLKYTMPDVFIFCRLKPMPPKQRMTTQPAKQMNSVILLIQRLDGYALMTKTKNPVYIRSVLGRLIPGFAEEKSAGTLPWTRPNHLAWTYRAASTFSPDTCITAIQPSLLATTAACSNACATNNTAFKPNPVPAVYADAVAAGQYRAYTTCIL